MAAPITHIVLTNKIFQDYFPQKNYTKFIIGTSLPDIRYLNVIERDKTHFPETKLNEVKILDSFNAGLKFHSIVDRVRERYLLTYNLYDKCPKSKYLTQSIKFLEDKTLYRHVNDWETYIDMFDNVLDSEVDIGLLDTDIRYWHNTLQKYFSVQPNNQSVDEFVNRIKLGQDVANEIKVTIKIIGEISEVTDYINSFYKKFGELVLEKSSQQPVRRSPERA